MTEHAPPRVFISYSWTTEEHTAWVADLGERLMNDGVDVVLDQWSLEDGHDVNAFMEKMVTDPTIKRVIIISDARYALKADGRAGGVGTETQIISQKVYESVDQTKFVPVVRERDGDGKACLPVYLTTRKYIDFSDPDSDADAYDQLLRNIFDRPQRPKPALGKPPSHLFDDDSIRVTSAAKAKRFCEVVANGKGNPSAAFQDFTEEFLGNMEQLRMTYAREAADTWCERIQANISTAMSHRDIFVDAVKTGVSHLQSDHFAPQLFDLLERLLAFTQRPSLTGVYFKCSEDNYKLLCYEFFLYTFAAAIKARKYAVARQLLDYRFVLPSTLGGADHTGHNFNRFNAYADSLEQDCAQREGRRRLSVMADLVHDRANRKDLRFSDVMQADILLCLAARGNGWYPRCLVYARSTGKCELFVRAVTMEGFSPLQQVLNVNTPNDLLQLLSSQALERMLATELFWHADVTTECLNFDELKRCWGDPASG